jgi:hypothetical protein
VVVGLQQSPLVAHGHHQLYIAIVNGAVAVERPEQILTEQSPARNACPPMPLSVNPQPVSRAAPPVPALRLSARRASSAVTLATSGRGRVCR